MDILIPLIQIYGFYLLIIGGAAWYLWPKITTLSGQTRSEDPEVVERKRREAYLKKQEELERLAAERRAAERERAEREEREALAALRAVNDAARDTESSEGPSSSASPRPSKTQRQLPPGEAVRDVWARRAPAVSVEHPVVTEPNEPAVATGSASTEPSPATPAPIEIGQQAAQVDQVVPQLCPLHHGSQNHPSRNQANPPQIQTTRQLATQTPMTPTQPDHLLNSTLTAPKPRS